VREIEIAIKGEPKEIAALVLEIQGQQTVPMHIADELSDPQVVEQVSESVINAIESKLP